MSVSPSAGAHSYTPVDMSKRQRVGFDLHELEEWEEDVEFTQEIVNQCIESEKRNKSQPHSNLIVSIDKNSQEAHLRALSRELEMANVKTELLENELICYEGKVREMQGKLHHLQSEKSRIIFDNQSERCLININQ
ncbi:uncharacterized protein LOC115230387 [Octopus sinensis]|uniref:Uncharacterized protein LOC115230387 n=1 Tax=Octopus sinensis TaxID=2607531 RepID=A0A6P7U2F8_9MOLL|nr:uncharacterized protein LOC115230387 [Octopus sinensis]